MANIKTKEPNLDELYDLLKKAKGDDRSFRAYAGAAGVKHSLFTRIKNKEFVPGFITLQKLTSETAAPRNGITLDMLLDAAGAPAIDYSGLMKGIKIVSAAIQLAKPQLEFQNTVLDIISKALSEKDINFTADDINKVQIIGLELGGRLLLHNKPISALWFRTWYADSEKDYGGLGSPQDKAIDLLREPLILNPDPNRKYVIAVNSIEVFDALCIYAGRNSYRGWLSAILIDSENKHILAEATLASFSGQTDELDPLTLTAE